jgi:hypothetical protein
MGKRAPEGVAGVVALGHREYVGGTWEGVGQLQFEFLCAQGLRPHHVFLDIACGALRGGVRFIPYLDAGNYLGMEKEEALVRRGLEVELAASVRDAKRPEFVVSSGFEFDRLSKSPDFSLAQSLFSHLTEGDIGLCLGNLRRCVPVHHRFYATFFSGDGECNTDRSHAHARFEYEPETLAAIGVRTGWQSAYIGEWGHPSGQVVMQFIPA